MLCRVVTTEADREAFLALLREYELSLDEDLRHGETPTIEVVSKATQLPNVAFVAQFDAPIGCVMLRHIDDGDIAVQHLYVKPSARGSGSGRALMKTAIDWAREHGYTRVVLDTESKRLAAAFALYKSMGFTECDPFPGVTYACATFMELKLQ